MLWKLFWLGLFTSIAYYICDMMIKMDVNKEIYKIRPGPCRQLKGIEYGSEDFAVVESLGLAFITSGMWYLEERPKDAIGRIFLFDFNQPENDPIDLEIVGLPDKEKFRPHGMTHWQEGSTVTLYVISHQPPDFTHTVEVLIFDEKEKKLRYVKTIKDPKIMRPNNLVAVGKDRFIVANEGIGQTKLQMLFEFIFRRKTGSVVYFDGKESHFLAQGLTPSTAVATDRERRHLFVGFVNEKAMGIYELSEDFTKINEISKLELKTALDNFYVDQQDVIWLGAHPIVGRLFLHVGQCDDPKSYSPSQVLRIKFEKDWKTAEISQVFADDGQFISASSSAAFLKGKLLIGSMARQAVVCDVLYDKF